MFCRLQENCCEGAVEFVQEVAKRRKEQVEHEADAQKKEGNAGTKREK
jgi:hypothetical protein